MTDRETVELFHLHFVRLLWSGKDKLSYAIKGGCNLRFFFGSPRLSEDLDLDVQDSPEHAVKERINALLESRAFRETLEAAGIAIGQTSAPKQTPTTQRWKVSLPPSGRQVELHTKIEVSRRGADGEARLETVDPSLTRRHRLMPVLARHYLLPTAVRQKVRALVGRKTVQARDVFDLSVLFAKAGDDWAALADLRRQTAAAIERVWAVSYADYAGQVMAFLDREYAGAFASEEAWEAMQLHVVSALETIQALP